VRARHVVLGLRTARAAAHGVGAALSRAQRLRNLLPRLREQRRSHGRKVVRTPPLFPGYTFVLIVSGWWNARWAAGVRRLVMDGQVPARVPDAVIAEIRSRERNGFVELSKPARLAPGMRVRVISGPLHDQIGLLAVLRPHERVLVLMHMLGGEQRVELARSAIEAV
jgi:transcriptional antiterminator RfaH